MISIQYTTKSHIINVNLWYFYLWDNFTQVHQINFCIKTNFLKVVCKYSVEFIAFWLFIAVNSFFEFQVCRAPWFASISSEKWKIGSFNDRITQPFLLSASFELSWPFPLIKKFHWLINPGNEMRFCHWRQKLKASTPIK